MNCIIGLISLQLSIVAQPPQNIQFNHFSQERGLPLHTYVSILQDKKGYMWFGTFWKGLLKYDGYSCRVFVQDPFNKNSLGTPGTRNLCNDIHGNIWIAGEGGVTMYDPHNENFIPYWYDWYGPDHQAEVSHDSMYLAALPSTGVTRVVSDRQGRVWIGLRDGLCFLDSPSAKVINLSTVISPDTLSHLFIKALMIDHNGLLWIGTENGINIYDRVKNKITLFDPGDKTYEAMKLKPSCILEDHSGNIWIGSSNKGIYRYNPSGARSKSYRHLANDKNSLPSDNVNSIIEDSHHQIWTTGDGGLSMYQPDTDYFITYRHDEMNKTSLATNEVADFFEDRSGAYWIGTREKGIEAYYPTGKKFLFYPYKDKGQGPLIGVSKNRTGKLFMSRFAAGMQEFDPGTGNFKSYEVKLHWQGGSHNYFGAFEDSDKNLWALGDNEGLHKIDRKTGNSITTYSKQGAAPSVCMTEGPDKRLWIGTFEGLRCYDPKSKIYSTAEELFPSSPELKFAIGIPTLYLDADGILWIAGSGLVILDTKTGKARCILQDTENPRSISSNSLNCFYDDEKGNIWIGTSWGLNRYDKKTELFTHYTVRDGLPDNNVSGILADEKGNLWLGTEKGICKFSPPLSENGKALFRNYDRSDGLPVEKFLSAIKGNDGNFYFNCEVGIVAFKPDELKDNPYIPPVLITDFSLFNKQVLANDSTGILKVPADETKEITLSYRQNDFSFAFTALSFIHPEKNKFAYKLEGFDHQWTHTDASKRYANYTNIGPGTYTFRVKASNNDGVWNDEGTSIKLIITPPYWKTTWFKLLCIIAGGMILYAIYYYRMQKIRDIQLIRNKIASDLHDDLGATLSSISIMSELVNQHVKDQSPQASSLLEKIGGSSRNMIESVNDMVWAINPQNDSFENIVKRMRSFASEILMAKDIDFNMDFDKNLLQSKLKIEMRRNFYLIFKEAVNNLAKYSGATNAFVSITSRDNNIKMVIRDDGCGFNPDSAKRGNGLINMQKRAEAMKASFKFKSAPGEGATIELEFKN